MTFSFTYPITLPSTPAPTKTQFRSRNSVGVSTSPFSASQQVQRNNGQWWEADITLPAMRRPAAEAWNAAMMKLNGKFGTFLIGDYDGRNPQGSPTGTPLVNGASQTGQSLITDGWTHSKSGLLLPGDYFQLGTGATARLYKVLDQVNSDSSGNATLDFWPALRSSPADNATMIFVNTVTRFRLTNDWAWNADELSNYSVAFSIYEDLTGP